MRSSPSSRLPTKSSSPKLKKEVYCATIARKEKEYLIKMKYQLLAKKDKLIEEEVSKRLRIGESLKAAHLTIDIKKEDIQDLAELLFEVVKDV